MSRFAKLSGILHSATLALEMLPAGAAKTAIVDSNSTAMAKGFHVLATARATRTGSMLLERRKIAEEARTHTGVYWLWIAWCSCVEEAASVVLRRCWEPS